MDATPASPPPAAWQVICLCAEWCGVCREWNGVFEELAATHPQLHFDWVDVEDEADAMGEVDIETFPTLLVAQGSRARFLGPDPAGARDAGPEAHALLHRLQTGVLPKR